MMAPEMDAPRTSRLSLLPLLGIIFFSTSGGPFGMEDLVASGPGLALVTLIVTPLVWSVPLAFTAAELSSMLPVEGGYYRWVRTALGTFWGFQMGWWNWLSSFLDMALYPVLFVKGLKFFRPDLSAGQEWAIALCVILSSLVVNLLGVKAVGRSALAAFIVVNLPFLLLVGFGMPKMTHAPWLPFAADDGSVAASFGLALSVAIWSYSGWECVSTFAGEVHEPSRTIPRATIAAVPLVACLYLLPLGVALGASDWTNWSSETHTIPQIAAEIVGPWLGGFVSLAIMASSWCLYNSLLLSNSRLPFAMAEDGLLPQWLTRVHPVRHTPDRALILCSAIYALFTLVGFRELVIMDVLVIAVSALLLFAALVVLRWRNPEMPRPFRLPGGTFGLFAAGASLIACVSTLVHFTMQGRHDTWKQAALAAALLASGPTVYSIRRFLSCRQLQ
jgi:amino acid transporter